MSTAMSTLRLLYIWLKSHQKHKKKCFYQVKSALFYAKIEYIQCRLSIFSQILFLNTKPLEPCRKVNRSPVELNVLIFKVALNWQHIQL
jgi:hypothetical protein